MKSTSFFHKITLALICSAVCFANFADAQRSTSSGKAPYCDEAIPKAQKGLQQEADSKCTTVTSCIACTERTSDALIYASLVVQPNCKIVDVEGAVVEDKANSKPVTVGNQPFGVEILQSPCTNGGITLVAFVPDDNAATQRMKSFNSNKRQETAVGTSTKPDSYSYYWELDGKKAGQNPELSCICGKIVKLKVTSPSGVTISRLIKISDCKPSKE